MIIVTGAAGFIGSNIVHSINARGDRDVIAVDDMHQEDKYCNLRDSDIADYLDLREFRDLMRRGKSPWSGTRAVLHQGACTNTTESDGRFMMDNNYTFSKEILHWCLERRIPLVYASSASVYGNSAPCVEEPSNEIPLNVYAYSKLQFDRHVRRLLPEAAASVVGLRYFNVYGPRELHKGPMASMAWQLYRQLAEEGICRLFEGTDGYAAGEQRRDFVFAEDVVAVNLFFARGDAKSGVYNCGTGRSRTFNDVARILIDLLGGGTIEYKSFPESLRGKYQSFTESDLARLQAAGYDRPFTSLEDGLRQMVEWAESRVGEYGPGQRSRRDRR